MEWNRRTELSGGIPEQTPGTLDPSALELIPQVKTAKDNTVKFTVWHGARKHVACLRTVKSMVENMITGVTKVCPSLLYNPCLVPS